MACHSALGKSILQLALVAVIPCSLRATEENPKEFSITIDKPQAEYAIEVGGTIDPDNLEITIENFGDTPVVNPRMTVNGLYDWYDVKSMVAEITRDCKTDEEKALALWWWVLYKRFQRSPDDRSSLHPVRAMNGYGYGICGHTSARLKCLWTAAGLKSRVQELWGHTVAEAYYDNAWHMLDGNVRVFYLDRDNRTIASLATVERDDWLIKRTIHPSDPWFRGPDPPGDNEEMVRYLVSHKDNYEEHSYDSEIAKDYTMAMTLKPGEKLVRWWVPKLGKFEGGNKRAEAPQRYANGQLIWEPDLRRIDLRPYLSVPGYGNIATLQEDGRSPAIHVADLQDSLHTRPSVFTLPIASPYPIVGGRFSCTLFKGGSSNLDLASIAFGKPGWESGDLYNFRWNKGSKAVDLDLDPKITAKGAIYSYGIGFSIRGNAESKPPTQAGVDGFRSVTDLQISPFSVPALAFGKNTVRFWHESPHPIKLRITHRWREVNGQRSPGRVETAVAPADGAELGSLTPTVKWLPALDPDASDKVVDYQVMVGLRPDCRWPLSPTLYQNVGSEKTEWTLPASFLNPGT
ncbi:MAG: hypothetical protein L0338_18020, partial [Acidobacteria bacterium]|nr:hypothetical protein [Acidobacteriota bacterium]